MSDPQHTASNIQNSSPHLLSLHDAVREGDKETVQYILEQDIDQVNCYDSANRSLLSLAVLYKWEDIAKNLILSGVDINDGGKGNWLPLNIAAGHGSMPLIDLLLWGMADINAQSRNGYTALMTAIRCCHADTAQKLLDLGANPNIACSEGWTPLHRAIELGDDALIQSLLDHRAEPNASQNEGCTPLLYAVELSQWKAVAILLKNRANPNMCSNSGRSPLSEASGFTPIELLLTDYGARS